MSKRDRGTGISLFAFLDVLICTMGCLIILLAMFIQNANQSAQSVLAAEQSAAVEAKATAASKLQEEQEEYQWRQEVVEKQRAEKTQELSDALDRLSHLEDHIRRLKSRAAELMNLAQEIDRGQQLKDEEREAARKELERLRAEIARKRQEAEETKVKLAKAQRWFALILYQGPQGTNRRPIYIECTEAGITLQPEDITLLPGDFNGPLEMGNPLDAALRAKREFLQRAGETASPYPLLVVRPDGVVAYSVARAAMKSWDDEFGYELIDGEKKLTFGDPDPTLVSMMQSTVRTARQKQAALAAAVPRKFQSDDALTSFRPDEALSEVPGATSPSGRGMGGGASGSNAGGRGFGGGSAIGGGGGFAPGSRGGLGEGGEVADGSGAGGGPGGTTGGKPGQAGKGDQYATGNAGGQAGKGPGGAGTGANGSETPGASGSGGAGGNLASGSANGKAGSSGSASGGANSRDGAGDSQSGGPASSNSAAGSSGASGGGGDPSGGAPSSTVNYSAGKRSPKRSGQNWGLPGAKGHATAITRPIRVVVEPGRVVLLPDRGEDRLTKEIPLKGAELTPQEADQFVTAVQKEMQWWGLAVEGGYWKPLLSMEVAPKADGRYQQLETALQGSGFELKRKVR